MREWMVTAKKTALSDRTIGLSENQTEEFGGQGNPKPGPDPSKPNSKPNRVKDYFRAHPKARIAIPLVVLLIIILGCVGSYQNDQQVTAARKGYQAAYSDLGKSRRSLRTEWDSGSARAKKLYPSIRLDNETDAYNKWIGGLNTASDLLTKKVSANPGGDAESIRKQTDSVKALTAKVRHSQSALPRLEAATVAAHAVAVREELHQLQNEVKTGQALVDSSKGNVEEDSTRAILSDACSRGSKLADDRKKGDTLAYLAATKEIKDAEKKVTDSQEAHKQAEAKRAEEARKAQEEAQKQREEAARRAEQARQEAQQREAQRRAAANSNSGSGSGGSSGGYVFYKNCTAVRAAGKAPLHRGEPGYSSHLDRDGDGVACE